MSDNYQLNEFHFLLERAFREFNTNLDGIVSAMGNVAASHISDGEFGRATDLAQRCQVLKDLTGELHPLEARMRSVLDGSQIQFNVQPASSPQSRSRRASANSARGHDGEEGLKRRPAGELHVRFPDGSLIQGNNASHTMALALQRLGFERVSELNEMVAGVPLVARVAHPKLSETYFNYQEIDGWFIATQLSNDRKATILRRVVALLGEEVEIIF